MLHSCLFFSTARRERTSKALRQTTADMIAGPSSLGSCEMVIVNSDKSELVSDVPCGAVTCARSLSPAWLKRLSCLPAGGLLEDHLQQSGVLAMCTSLWLQARTFEAQPSRSGQMSKQLIWSSVRFLARSSKAAYGIYAYLTYQINEIRILSLSWPNFPACNGRFGDLEHQVKLGCDQASHLCSQANSLAYTTVLEGTHEWEQGATLFYAAQDAFLNRAAFLHRLTSKSGLARLGQLRHALSSRICKGPVELWLQRQANRSGTGLDQLTRIPVPR